MNRMMSVWAIVLAGLAWPMVAAGAPVRSPDEVRALLEALLSTEYCGDVLLEGLAGSDQAIAGKISIFGGQMFDVPEAEWLPMLKKMTEEEIISLNDRLVDILAEIRCWEAAGERRDNSNDEGSNRLNELQNRIWEERARLQSMVIHLQYATQETNQVLDLLERVAKECPRECDFYSTVDKSLGGKACRDGQVWRCAELGRWYREQFGPNGDEAWELFCWFARHGIPMLRSKHAQDEGYRYLAEYGDSLDDSRRGAWFDRLALESLPGWAGSLQRRQLATRCSLPVDEEGPADESELTDLREVYGDWTKEDARD